MADVEAFGGLVGLLGTTLVVVGLVGTTCGGPGLGRLAPGLVAMKYTFNLIMKN